MGATKVSYVNFHGKKYVHLDPLIQALRELSDKGDKFISVDKLVEWLELIEYPEPTQ